MTQNKSIDSNAQGDLKNFYLKVNMQRASIKTVSARRRDPMQEITPERWLKITFKADSTGNSFVRVNTCVTEKKDPNNMPQM